MQNLDFTFNLNDIKNGIPTQVRSSDGRELCLVKIRNELSIFNNRCPHMGAPLTDGWVCKKTGHLRCPWHGYGFELQSGEIKDNPNLELFDKLRRLYKSYLPKNCPKYKLTSIPFVVEGNTVKVFKRASQKPDKLFEAINETQLSH
jgi:nitrite reductase/ring-hydroxylating ferredoxin subunit